MKCEIYLFTDLAFALLRHIRILNIRRFCSKSEDGSINFKVFSCNLFSKDTVFNGRVKDQKPIHSLCSVKPVPNISLSEVNNWSTKIGLNVL